MARVAPTSSWARARWPAATATSHAAMGDGRVVARAGVPVTSTIPRRGSRPVTSRSARSSVATMQRRLPVVATSVLG